MDKTTLLLFGVVGLWLLATGDGLVDQVLKPVPIRFVPLLDIKQKVFEAGFEVMETDLPFVVAIDFRGRKGSWFCAGAILAHCWVVTVASCTKHASHIAVNYGAYQRDKSLFTQHVTSKAVHTSPKNKDFKHDLALIRTGYVRFSDRVRAVSLPSQKIRLPYIDEWTYSAGWGRHHVAQMSTNQLRLIQVEAKSNHFCRKSGFGQIIQDSMMCTALAEGDNSCLLDSGSPLVLRDLRVIVGVASFASQLDCRQNRLLVYTRLTEYTQWIRSLIIDDV
ncbi:GL23187 [Drosophila persimilis]|uniref:GL23187 n=1 Tax=Drosophila persimilis TaxID=7234 RepID=B4HBL3_DROPE|nr:serine protease 1 [Drosophila persimilis]EDW39401.1 GL23187 [Drosophila persimilis]